MRKTDGDLTYGIPDTTVPVLDADTRRPKRQPGAEAAARDDLARDVARAWALAVGCDAQREQLRYEMPHLAWALDRLAAAYGVTE